ncbi:Spo12 family protein [Acanthocheilonema viteae]
MSTPVEDAAAENVVDGEHDTSPPPSKMTRTEWKAMLRQRKHLNTVCSQGSEQSDDDFPAGDAVEIDSDGSDSPPAESDRLTPIPKFRGNDSDSDDEVAQPDLGHGDLLKDLENVTDSSDSSRRSLGNTEYNESNDLLEHARPISPLNLTELPESSTGPKTPCFSQADRVATLRKRMAIYSPSDNMLSPCTMKLNRPKNFFRMRQAKASSLLSAEQLGEDSDDVVEVENTITGEADTTEDDGTSKTGDEDIGAESQEGSDHDDI